MTTRAVLAGIAALGILASRSSAEVNPDPMKHWPAWRGPMATGVAPHGTPPAEWGETKNVRWKVELPGEGHSTPIVWNDRVYVQSALKMEKPAAPAAPAAPPSPAPSSAAVPPEAAVAPASFRQSEPREGSAAPQPPPEGQPQRRGPPKREPPTEVYQFSVLALDRTTGATVWKTVVKEEVPHEPGHLTASQASSSPVTDGERIYASFGSRGLYCLDMNGKVLWEKDLGDMKTRNQFGEGSSPAVHGDTLVLNWDHEGESFIVALDKRTGEQRWKVPRDERTSWSTPLILEDGGRAQVVVSAAKRVRSYDLLSGEEVWACGGLGPNCIPTPVADSGLVFVMSGYEEGAAMAIRYAGAKGDITASDRVAWRIDRGTSYVPSPLLYEGKVYFLERYKGVLSCYDLKSGKAHFEGQRLDGIGNIYASPVGAGGRIYLVDREGNGLVIRHGETLEVIARNKLDDAFDASPVVAGGELYLRGHRSLYCLAEK